jgi:hypothetical protein
MDEFSKKGKVYLSSNVSNLFRMHGINEQLNMKTETKGAVERQVFLTKEFITALV